MNKKGFTLIEMLLVITLLVTITGSSFFGIRGISDKVKEKRYNELIKEIELATDVYINNSDLREKILSGEEEGVYTRIYVLQNEGYLDSDLINPKTNKRVPGNLSVYSYLDRNGEIKHEIEL